MSTTTPAPPGVTGDAGEEGDITGLENTAGKVLVALLIISLVLLAVGGNLLVIVSYCRDPRLRTAHNFYILNLAVADLLLGLHSMTFYAYYTLDLFTWPTGYVHCKIWNVIDFTASLLSVIMTIVISLDRLVLVKTGIDYTRKITWRMAYLQVTVAWLLAFLLYGPAIIGWNYWTGQSVVEPDDCDVEFAYDFPFTITTAVVEFGLNFIVLCVINLLIYLDIRKRMRVSAARTEAMKRALTAGQDTTTLGAEASDQKKQTTEMPSQREVRRDVKAAKALMLLVVALAVTWGPYTIATITVSACETCVNRSALEFFNWLLYSKSAINPFLYAYNSARYRENFARMLRPFCPSCKCCCCCCPRSSGSPGGATNTANDLSLHTVS